MMALATSLDVNQLTALAKDDDLLIQVDKLPKETVKSKMVRVVMLKTIVNDCPESEKNSSHFRSKCIAWYKENNSQTYDICNANVSQRSMYRNCIEFLVGEKDTINKKDMDKRAWEVCVIMAACVPQGAPLSLVRCLKARIEQGEFSSKRNVIARADLPKLSSLTISSNQES